LRTSVPRTPAEAEEGCCMMTGSSKGGGKRNSVVNRDEITKWSTEAKAKKKQDLEIDADSIFKMEPSWKGQRRKNLFTQRIAEAEDELVKRRGKGAQELWEAARVGNFERIMDLLFRSKDYVPSAKDLSHGIHAAAAHGREDMIDLLVRHGADPSDNAMAQGFTPIMVAAAKGHVHAMLMLIDRGGQVNMQNEMGQTALHLAATRGHAHVCKALVAEGAEGWHLDQYGRTADDCAQMDTEEHAWCREILQLALRKPKEKEVFAAHQDLDGKTPAHHWLVSSVHGQPRASERETPTNLV